MRLTEPTKDRQLAKSAKQSLQEPARALQSAMETQQPRARTRERRRSSSWYTSRRSHHARHQRGRCSVDTVVKPEVVAVSVVELGVMLVTAVDVKENMVDPRVLLTDGSCQR
jgi:hypothetical protein